MFPSRYWPIRMFPGRFWPPGAGTPVADVQAFVRLSATAQQAFRTALFPALLSTRVASARLESSHDVLLRSVVTPHRYESRRVRPYVGTAAPSERDLRHQVLYAANISSARQARVLSPYSLTVEQEAHHDAG